MCVASLRDQIPLGTLLIHGSHVEFTGPLARTTARNHRRKMEQNPKRWHRTTMAAPHYNTLLPWADSGFRVNLWDQGFPWGYYFCPPATLSRAPEMPAMKHGSPVVQRPWNLECFREDKFLRSSLEFVGKIYQRQETPCAGLHVYVYNMAYA